jgi:hypothetical protein
MTHKWQFHYKKSIRLTQRLQKGLGLGETEAEIRKIGLTSTLTLALALTYRGDLGSPNEYTVSL